MSDQDPKPSIDDLLSGVDENVNPTADQAVPDFVSRARQEAAQRGMEPIDLLEKQAFDALRAADYPTPACIKPSELELVGQGEQLAPDRLMHLATCVPCRRLMRSATRRPYSSPPLPVPVAEPRQIGAFSKSRPRPPRWPWFSPIVPALGLAAAVAIAVGASIFLPRVPALPPVMPQSANAQPAPSAVTIRPAPEPNTLPIPVQKEPPKPEVIAPAVPPDLTPLSHTPASIAVLPVEADEKLAHFGAGVSESMAQRLSRIQGLDVIWPQTATAEALVAAKSGTVARNIGVDTLITTRLKERDTGLEIDAEMVDVASGRTRWAKNYSTSAAQLFKFNTNLAADISLKLRPELTAGQLRGVMRADTDDGGSYLDYLRGRAAWAKRDEKGFDEAIRFFQQALKANPEYALAYVGLADAYSLQGNYNHRPRAEAFDEAEKAARRALQIDPDLAEAHTSLALVNLYRRNFRPAEEGFKQATRINPSYSLAHRWYANLLMAFERFSEARQHIARAVALDPLSRSTRVWKGVTLFYERKPEESAKELRSLLGAQPTYLVNDFQDWQVHLSLGQALEQGGKVAEAIEQLEKARDMKTNEMTLAALGHAYAKANRRADATAILKQIVTEIPNHSETSVAIIYAALGDKDKAFESLEKAYDQLDTDLLFLRIDSLFDDLRSDRRFDALIDRVGLRRSLT